MPELYAHKKRAYPLSNLNETRQLVRISCGYCKRGHVYRPDDLIEIFGDVDVDSLARRMHCEKDRTHGSMDVSAFSPQGSQAVGLRIRRLAAMKIVRVPIWRDD